MDNDCRPSRWHRTDEWHRCMDKRFPVFSDYIGLQIATTVQNHISVDIAQGKVLGAFIE